MASSLKDYLKRYADSNDSSGVDAGKGKPKKKRKGRSSLFGRGTVIVDDDALWQKEEKPEDEDVPDEEGDGPAVIEDVEVKRMQRMEAMKTYRPYLSVANDGSGWVTVRDDETEASPRDIRRGYGSDDSGSRSLRVESPDVSIKRKRNDSPDVSPVERVVSEDLSPSRLPISRTEGAWTEEFRELSPPRKRRHSPDLSPPRRRHDSPVISPPRRRHDSPGISPPRRMHDSPGTSPPRKLNSDDLSPPRKSKSSTAACDWNQAKDLSRPRKRSEYEDLSPPRRRQDSPDVAPRRRVVTENSSLPRRSKFSSGPPDDEEYRDSSRFGKSRGSSEFASQGRRHDPAEMPLARSVVSQDLSPPRRSKPSTTATARSHNESLDLSSPRRRRDSPNAASVMRGVRKDSSPPRKSRNSIIQSQDVSPPRKRRDSPDVASARRVVTKDNSPPRESRKSSGSLKLNQSQDLSPSSKKLSGRMADGAFAGLKTDREVVSEAERKRAAEAKLLSELDPSLSGRGAETVFRDKRGRRLEGLEELLRQQKGESKPAEEPLEWGKGLAQKKVAVANLAELEAEKSKPFARYRDDAELDKSLKEAVRWGDPMAHLVKTKITEAVLEDLGAREEMKASGFIIPQNIPNHSWLKAGLAPPPNRYDIRPGRHWDGVDRSTGYEQGLFKNKNEKKARDLEAYLWSVSDM